MAFYRSMIFSTSKESLFSTHLMATVLPSTLYRKASPPLTLTTISNRSTVHRKTNCRCSFRNKFELPFVWELVCSCCQSSVYKNTDMQTPDVAAHNTSHVVLVSGHADVLYQSDKSIQRFFRSSEKLISGSKRARDYVFLYRWVPAKGIFTSPKNNSYSTDSGYSEQYKYSCVTVSYRWPMIYSSGGYFL